MNIEDRTILLLGGSGLVGLAVARALLEHRPRKIVISALTQAEADVVLALGEGLSSSEIAQLRGVSANTVRHPIPTLKRALNFGRALRKAILSYPDDVRVVVLGTGGLSHQLDGQRAGFINREFDEMCMEKIVTDPEALTKISRYELVEKAGAQGTEFLMWMMMRGALGDKVGEVSHNYHIPISNTGAGTLLLECAA